MDLNDRIEPEQEAQAREDHSEPADGVEPMDGRQAEPMLQEEVTSRIKAGASLGQSSSDKADAGEPAPKSEPVPYWEAPTTESFKPPLANDASRSADRPRNPFEQMREKAGRAAKGYSGIKEKLEAIAQKHANAKGVLAVSGAFAFLAVALVGSCSVQSSAVAEAQTTAATMQGQVEKLQKEKDELTKKVEELTGIVDELENGAAAQLVDIKNAYEEKDWEKVLALYGELHKSYNGSPEDQEGKKLADEAQKAIDKAKAEEEERKRKEEEEAQRKKEEEEKRKAEEAARKAEEEAKAYDTGITYDQIAREPDAYAGSKLKFTGKVLQVIRDEAGGTTTIRFAVDSDYDKVVLGTFMNDITQKRILEDDVITIKGTFISETSYETIFGATVSLPSIFIAEIQQ